MVKNMPMKLLTDLFTDLTGATGIIITFQSFQLEGVEQLIRLFAGAGGLILLVLSIQYKRILIKKEKEKDAKP